MIAIVAGALAAKPGNGGNAWTRLAWTRGLELLGFETYFVELLAAPASAEAALFFDAVARGFGTPARWALLDPDGVPVAGGLGQDALREAAARSELLINLSGHLQDPSIRALISRAVYIDDDPGYTQLWHATGAIGERLLGHVAHYTFGTRIGSADCSVPVREIAWRPLLPPVVLSDWPERRGACTGPVTTVASWRGPYGPIEHDGVRYGQKVHEFRRFQALPRLAGRELEVALQLDPGERDVIDTLRAQGWRVHDAVDMTSDPDAFRRYVQASSAEFSVAQNIYVRSRCGWFSDRTTRYLASGKPAVVQDTGFAATLPTGEGLLAFSTPEEAVAALRSLSSRYDEHAAAARAIAAQHFDARVVIGALCEEVL